MKKITAFVSLFFLAASFGQAQTQNPAPRRKHTRPPYSGPLKHTSQAPKLSASPSHGNPAPRPKGTSDHIIVR